MSNIQGVRISNNAGFATLISCIKEVRDPRINRKQQHPFVSIITLALCAVIGGANSWVAIAEFGNNHTEWFKEFLDLPNGIPSHDTFNRVFGLINHKELMEWLWIWLESLCEVNDNQIAIDGKIVKAWNSKNPLTLLRACGGQSKLILGQVKVKSNSNEITAIPEMLNMLYLKGKIF